MDFDDRWSRRSRLLARGVAKVDGDGSIEWFKQEAPCGCKQMYNGEGKLIRWWPCKAHRFDREYLR